MIYRYPDRVSDEAIFFQGEYRLALDHFASGIPLAAEIWVRSSGTRSTELVYVHHASEHSDQNAHLRRRKLGGEKKSSIVQLVSPIAQWNLMLEGAHVWIDKDGDM